jgi:hypothetical protein
MAAKTMNTQGFLNQFLRLHQTMPDRPFCWVLGSGASSQSGIPPGAKFTMDWLGEMYEMYSDHLSQGLGTRPKERDPHRLSTCIPIFQLHGSGEGPSSGNDKGELWCVALKLRCNGQ